MSSTGGLEDRNGVPFDHGTGPTHGGSGAPHPTGDRPRRRRPMIVAGIVGAALLVGGLSLGALQGQPLATPQAAPSATTLATPQTAGAPTDAAAIIASMQRRDPNDPYALGRVDAPVVLVEFSDWRCPFCGLWARTTKPELQKYLDDGTLRIEYRDMPIFGEQSELAARAGRAAGMQDRFWPFYDAVFAAAPERGHADLSAEKLVAFADQAGVPDLKKFETDMRSEAAADLIRRDLADARTLGAPGSVPLFLIGTEAVSGAQPTESFVAAIERQAAGRP